MFDGFFTKKVDTSPLFGFFLGILFANQEWVSRYLSARIGSEELVKISIHDTLLAGLIAAMVFSVLFSIFRIMVQYIDLKLRKRWLVDKNSTLKLSPEDFRALVGKIDQLQKSVDDIKHTQTKSEEENQIVSYYRGA